VEGRLKHTPPLTLLVLRCGVTPVLPVHCISSATMLLLTQALCDACNYYAIILPAKLLHA
jgi:hypothetical protein